jgi:hypothetical protein
VEADHNLRCVSPDDVENKKCLMLTIYSWALLVTTKVLWWTWSRV